MKKFIRNCIFMFFILLAVLAILLLLSKGRYRDPITKLTGASGYAEGNNGPAEIIPVVEKVRSQDHTTNLILGDSVCFRLFSELQNLNPNYCIAGTNRGITMSGQYILMKEYLDNHKDATDVYLILVEDSLITPLDTTLGYQYAVQPFLMTDTLNRLDDKTLTDMKRTYGSFMINKKMATFTYESPFYQKMYLNLLNKIAPVSIKFEIPDVAERYLIKMYETCQESGVSLHLIASPLSGNNERKAIESDIRSAYEQSKLPTYFPNYFDQLTYYDPSEFSDGIHPSVSRERMNEMIMEMQKKSHSLEDLLLE